MPKHKASAISRMWFFILFLLILFGGIVVKEAPASQAESGATDIELKKYIDSQGRPESSRGLASYRLTTVKALRASFFAVASAVLIVGRFMIAAQTFTEGARARPQSATPKPGHYCREPE